MKAHIVPPTAISLTTRYVLKSWKWLMYTSTDNYDLMWEAAKTSISDHIVLPFIWKLLFLEHLLRSNMKRKISQLFNAWFVFSFTSREDNQQLLRNTKNKPNYKYHKSSWSKSSAWTLANQRGEGKDRNIITGFKQLPNMQLSFKIDTFIHILIRSLVKCKHNKRCWPTDFFYWCITLTSSPSSTVFLVLFFFYFPTSQSSNVFTQPLLSHMTETVENLERITVH